ncbi:hypothetical protein PR002_g10274 [Phytophthora rubi]|uniref:Uncharacterized protein n=1 Tax=Phytophthora rubi TaxID=129364 RepID=A0A6A3MLF1_9STRA|nr:hypothetical protein PR002_g10274 [Phytophthora rubi]
MLSKLILRLRDSSEKKVTPVLLRCIGSLCVDVPSHCNIATTLTFTFEEQPQSLGSTVTKSLSELGNSLAGNDEVALSAIEGVFLCIDSIVSAADQHKLSGLNRWLLYNL